MAAGFFICCADSKACASVMDMQACPRLSAWGFFLSAFFVCVVKNAQFLKLIFKKAYFLIKNKFCVVKLLTFLKIGDIFVFESERGA